MPTYEFECSQCGDQFEIFLSLKDPQPQRCKKCRGKLEKVFSPVGIMFKGSGFYVNDNRSAAKNSAAAPVVSKTASGNGSSSTKSADAAPKASDSGKDGI